MRDDHDVVSDRSKAAAAKKKAFDDEVGYDRMCSLNLILSLCVCVSMCLRLRASHYSFFLIHSPPSCSLRSYPFVSSGERGVDVKAALV